jgi:hypothetical protein
LNIRSRQKENFEIGERWFFLSNEKMPEDTGEPYQVMSKCFTFLECNSEREKQIDFFKQFKFHNTVSSIDHPIFDQIMK